MTMVLPDSYRPLTLSSGVQAAAARTPAKTAIREGDRSLSYAALGRRIRQVTGGVIDGLGLAKGDHIAILSPNCLAYVEFVCGASAAGVAVATLNPRLIADEVAFICNDCQARALFVAPALEEMARAIEFQTVREIIVLDDRYEDWLGKARETEELAIQEWDVFAIPYTAGTTGKPKGVLLSHRSRTLCFFAMASEYGCYSPRDRNLVTAPLFHGAGFAFAMASLFFGGYCEILPRFDPELLLRHLHGGRMSTTFMVPTHFHALFALEQAVLERYRDNRVRTIISNAAPLPQATKERIVDYFGDTVLYESYGSTEGGVVTNLGPEDQLRKIECVGLPFAATLVSVRREDGTEVEAGEVGELFSISPYLFNGYWQRAEETARSIVERWVTAGDMAVRDEEGFVYLVDRKSDMIISGGINLYPREIEEALYHHPTVAEAAVIGAPDDRWGEAVKAYVVARPGERIDTQALTEHCRARLSAYKIPKSIEILDSLPKNAAGKVLRRELRARAGKEGSPHAK